MTIAAGEKLALAGEGATKSKPVILVIDELPYLAAKEPSIEAILQMVWDRDLQGAPVLVILIGSDEAMMGALTEQGRPLYDRAREMATALWEIVDPYMRFWLEAWR